jgi:hypothetical protein
MMHPFGTSRSSGIFLEEPLKGTHECIKIQTLLFILKILPFSTLCLFDFNEIFPVTS